MAIPTITSKSRVTCIFFSSGQQTQKKTNKHKKKYEKVFATALAYQKPRPELANVLDAVDSYIIQYVPTSRPKQMFDDTVANVN